jgi:hypothetical protein
MSGIRPVPRPGGHITPAQSGHYQKGAPEAIDDRPDRMLLIINSEIRRNKVNGGISAGSDVACPDEYLGAAPQ